MQLFKKEEWNKYYEFNQTDLRSSMDIIDSMFNNNNNILNIKQIPFKLSKGLLNNALYGGKIYNNISTMYDDENENKLSLSTPSPISAQFAA